MGWGGEEEGDDKNLVGGIFDDVKIYNIYIYPNKYVTYILIYKYIIYIYIYIYPEGFLSQSNNT